MTAIFRAGLALCCAMILTGPGLAPATTILAPDDIANIVDNPVGGNFDSLSGGAIRVTERPFFEFRAGAEFDLAGQNGVTAIHVRFPAPTLFSSVTQQLRMVTYPGDGTVAVGDAMPTESPGNTFDFSVTPSQPQPTEIEITDAALDALLTESFLGVLIREEPAEPNEFTEFQPGQGSPIELVLDQVTPFEIPLVASAPTIDGTVSAPEWADALQSEVGFGASPVTVYLQHDGSSLFIAIVDTGNDQFADEEVDLFFDDEGGPVAGSPAGDRFDGFFPTSCPSDEGRIRFALSGGAVTSEFIAFEAGQACRAAALPGNNSVAFKSINQSISGAGAQFEAQLDLVGGPLQVAPGETFGAFLGFYDGGLGDYSGAIGDPELRERPLSYTPITLPEPSVASSGGAALVSIAGLARRRRRPNEVSRTR